MSSSGSPPSKAYTSRTTRVESLDDDVEPRKSNGFVLLFLILIAFGLGASTFWLIQTIFIAKGHGTSYFLVEQPTKYFYETQKWVALDGGKTAANVVPGNPTNQAGSNSSRPGQAPEQQNPIGAPGPAGLVTLNSSTSVPPKRKPTAEELRISKALGLVPESYSLTVKVYLPGYGAEIPPAKLLKYDGVVIINMVAARPTKTIELNSEALRIDAKSCKVTQNGKTIPVTLVQNEELRKVTFILNENVEAGKFLLKVVFEGDINTSLGGLYQSKYTSNGVEKITAVTQLEPEDGRKFVPCFDEPEYKATWRVTIIHPKGTTALSNGMEGKPTVIDPEFLSTSFKETPKMSSYLLAIFVSEFKYITGHFSNGRKLIRIWSRPEAIEDTAFALEAGIKSLDFFEKFYDIEFPLEKQDMIALPDFSMGAMENWGLVTYREVGLLYNNRTFSMDRKRNAAITVAHELAHQWFGNLVTMKWWDDLWLNEGFATYMEILGTDAIDKNFGTDDFMLENIVTVALAADAVAASHPVSFKIDTAEEVMESFDMISYGKGASVIKMIKETMGEQEFKRGIQAYLTKFSHSNTVAMDLWTSLNNFTGPMAMGPDGRKLNVTDLALQWTLQMGFPYLTLESNGTELKITAKRFKKNEEAKEKEKYANPAYGFEWDVPLWYQVEGEGEKFTWVRRGNQGKLVPFTNKAVIINSGMKSFIRTNYDQSGWEKIIAALKKNPESFSRSSRYALVSDAFEMASIGRLKYPTLFELISYAEKEKDPLPMSAILSGLDKFKAFFGSSEESLILRKFLRKLLQPSYNLISLDNIKKNDGIEAKMHAVRQDKQVLFKYCGTKDSKCIKKVNDLFESQVISKCTKKDDVASKCSQVAASIRSDVYCTGVRHGDEVVFNKMLEMYKRETDPAERSSLMNAFTCSIDVPTLRFLLESILDPSSSLIRYQDATHIYGGVAGNEYGRELILNHLISRWTDIHKRFKSTGSFIVNIIRDSTFYIRSEKELQQLKDFVNSTPEAAKYHEFAKGIETAEYRLSWIKKNLKEVAGIMTNLI